MYQNFGKGWTKHIDFILLDILSLEIALLIASILQGETGYGRTMLARQCRDMFWITMVLSICAAFFLNSYPGIIRRGYLKELKQTIYQCTFVMIGIIVWMFLIRDSGLYLKKMVLIMYPAAVCVMAVLRVIWKHRIRRRMIGREEYRKIFIISTQKQIRDVIAELNCPYRTYQLTACVLYDSSDKVGERIGNVPVVADKENLIQYIQRHIIDEVFIDLPDQEKEAERLMNIFVSMGLVVHMNLAKMTTNVENKKVQGFSGFMVLSSGMKFASAKQMFLKRGMDICGAIVGLLFTGIAFIIFGPIIKKQSPGAPVLFSQERVGRNGRRFKIYKFRTMYPDAEERKKELMAQNKMSGLMFKLDDDPRVIPIGKFLRKSSIDELPQFWNVLKGDMSLVGTRPPTVDEYEQYEPTHRKRLAMKPGLTGMWQVSGRSDIVDFEEVVALDARYISSWTFGMDIKILFRTIGNVLGQKGAV